MQHGLHDIENELVFTGHDGYVFHESCRFGASHKEKLEIVQNFVRRKSRERQLKDRLHAIWFVLLSSSVLNSQILLQVLHPDGQYLARDRHKVFQGYLPGQEWYVQTPLYECGSIYSVFQFL